jgi:mRNA-degrading endonuclease RelE of RelBE toxin-antitoxin system
MYEVQFTHDALRDLRKLKKFEQNIIFEAIQTQLIYQPLTENRNRFRRDPPDITAHIPHPQLAHTRIEGVEVNHSRQ